MPSRGPNFRLGIDLHRRLIRYCELLVVPPNVVYDAVKVLNPISLELRGFTSFGEHHDDQFQHPHFRAGSFAA